MSLEYPDLIDPQKAAEGHRTFSGTIALSRMERLKAFLAKDIGEARFTASFDKDSLVGVSVQIEVDAVLWLQCQRSLEPYQEVIHRSSLLAVIEDITDEGLLPEAYEATLAEHGKVAFLVMVEDELLLGLPQVPRNPELPELAVELDEKGVVTATPELQTGKLSGQQAAQQAVQPLRQQPFAGLADQLKEFSSKGKKQSGTGKK
jgi:uncharacterized protein